MFLKWRVRHELAHAWYPGSTQHNSGVCKGRCTLDPLGLPRRDTPDWEVSSHQQGKSLCLYTDISLPLYQSDPQIKVALGRFYVSLNISGVSFSCNKYESKNESSFTLQA